MEILKKLDPVVTALAQELYASSPLPNWQQQRVVAKYNPDASVSGHDYDYMQEDGVINKSVTPELAAHLRIGDLTLRHWQLTQDLGQPRWYKMILTVQRSGKFNAEFEYKDDYKEGDIMQRG